MKKSIFIILIIALISIFFTTAKAEEYIPYTDPEAGYKFMEAGVLISYPLGEGTDNIYCNGRLCVSLDEGVRLMGGTYERMGMVYRVDLNGKSIYLDFSAESSRPKIFLYNQKLYVSLYELITPFDYEFLVYVESNSAVITKYGSNVGVKYPEVNAKQAYIRLEDIVADGLKPDGTGKYTADMLEKLKYTAEYLYLNNQQYYVAWIPVYGCPSLNYINDVSQNYNLYNSYFIYVLDFMSDHNGHIGLHGYTHQYGEDESGVGYEWGANTPYSVYEQQERMIKAKQTCKRLGFEDEFFEFPHYEATDEQLKMAENYFDTIYQAFPNAAKANYVTFSDSSDRTGKTVRYIPTPADYVHYKRDYSIFEKITGCANNDYALSLYFHPVIDEDNIIVSYINGSRVFSYNEEAMLPLILKRVFDSGYSFSSMS